MIKMLHVKYGLEATSMLRNHKYARIETSITRRWFNYSLSKQLIHVLLNNGMLSGSNPDINCQKFWNKEDGLKLKMLTPNHIKHKPVRCNASPMIKKFEKHTNLNNCRWRWWEAEEHDTSGVPTPTEPFPPSISRTGGDTAISRLLATWINLNPTLQVRPLSKGWTTRPWHRSLLCHEMEPSPWPDLATPLRRKRLGPNPWKTAAEPVPETS